MDIAWVTSSEGQGFARAVRAVDPLAVLHEFPHVDALVDAATRPHPWRVVALPASARAAISALRGHDPTLPIVAVARSADVTLAAEVARCGASDLLVLGDQLRERVLTLLVKLRPLIALREENRRLKTASGARWALTGDSPAIVALRETIERVARIPRPVLILGERGTGKELVARALHEASGAPGAWVAVNCAAFPDALLESELFGHERGAYTGADRRAEGKFEQADRGTLFLDEIGAMSLPFQQKILRVVEYGEFTRVGGQVTVSSTARIVAATNAPLLTRVADGSFLPDLYDRLSFEVIRVPPLRERGEDIAALARGFLEAFYGEVAALPDRALGDAALDALRRYPFPGNVRELKHKIERAASRPGPREIGVDELDLGAPPPLAEGTFASQVAQFERQLLTSAIERAGGNHAAAARALGLTYAQMRWYVKQRLGG